MNNKIVFPNYLKPFNCDEIIRVGKDNDGGYLIDKRSMECSEILLSFGIDHDWSFEKEFLKNTNCIVHTYDGSVGLIFFLKKIKMRMKGMATKPSREYFEVSKYWLKLPLKFYNFFNLVKNKNGPNHYEINVGNKPEQITFKNTLDNLPIKSEKIFLKIDIENDEYTLLNDILKYSYLFTGLVIEFHRAKDNILEIKRFIELFDLKIVHVHINNYCEFVEGTIPDVFEISFSKFTSENYIKHKLPHRLDQRNDPSSWIYEIEFSN